MTSGLRKLVLSTHLLLSVGWIGAVAAYLSLDVVAATSAIEQQLRVSYVAMDMIVRNAIVPAAIGSLLTGVVIALGTRWGLIRHYWVLISFLLTLLAVVVLLAETRTIAAMAQMATDPRTPLAELQELGGTVVHSVGGLLVLLLILVLNVYKPRGMTRYGWNRQQEGPTDSESRHVKLDQISVKSGAR